MANTLAEIGESVAKLRALLSDARKDLTRIQTLQDDLASFLEHLWDTTRIDSAIALANSSQLQWKEFISLVASGRILSLAAQAEDSMTALPQIREKRWISRGPEYARWLGGGVVKMLVRADSPSIRNACVQFCGKALGIGYPDDVVAEITDGLALSQGAYIEQYQLLIQSLAKHEQRQVFLSTLNILEKRHFSASSRLGREEKSLVGGSAKLVAILLESIPHAEGFAFDSLTRQPILSTAISRSILCALPLETIERVLERSWQQFGDKLYIKHTPILQQEALTQILLLAAGYVHRANPTLLQRQARESNHASAISARLGSSSTRIKFLGMAVATSISKLMDKPNDRMDFGIEDMETDEAKWYIGLVDVQDTPRTLDSLRSEMKTVTLPDRSNGPKKAASAAPVASKVGATSSKPAKSKIIEVVSGSESEDEDLVPYAKPDDDDEDSEDDATLVERKKPVAPVYIRTLISQLNDTSNAAQHVLALRTAPSLIRRKSSFGSELADRAPELAHTLLSLQDVFETPEWHEFRLSALVALTVAQPREIGKWLAETYFTGEWSMGQRSVCLSALGLGGRELAGFKDEDDEEDKFPSKQLPERLHKLYLQEGSGIEKLARKLEGGMGMTPVETKRKPRPRTKVIRNDLSKVVAECFFFPLTGGWVSAHGHASRNVRSPHLLPLYLKTLSILLTSAGASTLSQPLMAYELWSLTLSLRSHATSDLAVLEAVLFALLTVLNVNADDKRRVAVECGRELVETHEWAQQVFDRLEVRGGGDEGERCRTLVAGVLVATKEIVEGYQRLLVGEMASV